MTGELTNFSLRCRIGYFLHTAIQKGEVMKIGLIGLGKMGSNMVLRLLKDKHEVVVYDKSSDPVNDLENKGAIGAVSLPDLLTKLQKKKIVWLMIPAGHPTIQS